MQIFSKKNQIMKNIVPFQSKSDTVFGNKKYLQTYYNLRGFVDQYYCIDLNLNLDDKVNLDIDKTCL